MGYHERMATFTQDADAPQVVRREVGGKTYTLRVPKAAITLEIASFAEDMDGKGKGRGKGKGAKGDGLESVRRTRAMLSLTIDAVFAKGDRAEIRARLLDPDDVLDVKDVIGLVGEVTADTDAARPITSSDA